MAPLTSLLAAAFLATTVSAHFELLYPPTIGLQYNSQGSGPCGGITPDFTKDVTDFHVGGDIIALNNGHPQGAWLFRGTVDQTAGGNWTQLFPLTQQDGIGRYCAQQVTAPESFVGKKGVISVVCSAEDGMLFQCATVNFVAGTGSQQSQCTNGSATSVSFTQNAGLSALVGNGSSGTGPSPSTSTGSSPSPSRTPNAGSSLERDLSSGFFGGIFAAASLAMFGAVLVF